ncbi:MAG: 4Fe-4S dicluster domain-containing protein [Deferrisomatales bacterium]
MATYGMVIDLQRCVGCGACGVACKTENNTSNRANGQTFNWADFHVTSEGRFPNARLLTLPVLCNHCTDAPCVEACPVTPKAMFKTDSGITMHDDDRCIGCQACQEACPYSATDAEKEQVQYSVLSFNESEQDQHAPYRSTEALVENGTGSGAEIVRLTEQLPPYRTLYKHPNYGSTRRVGVTEKCIFCEHRVALGEDPWCVVVCPSQARVFGDLADPNSEPSRLLKTHKGRRLKSNKGEFLAEGEAGTRPNVYYVRNYTKR